MSNKDLEIKEDNGKVSIEIIIGNGDWGTYKIKLWNKNKQNPKTVGNGFSGDLIDDIHKVGAPSTVNGRYLTWKIRVASYVGEGESNLNATVLIKQKGITVDGGTFTYSGKYDGVKTVGGYVRLISK